VTPGQRAVDPGRSLALLWGSQDKPARSGLTIRAIVAAAIEVADADGIEALSMRRTADRLGAATMTLYTHVPGKPVLIELMIDTVCGQLYADVTEPSTQAGGWRGSMQFVAHRNWELYLTHPWLLPVLTGRPVLGPHVTAKYEAELRPLDRVGLTDVEMDSVLTLVLAHVEGMARWHVSLGRQRADSGQDDAEWWVDRAPALAALMDSRDFPLAARVGQAAGEYHRSAGDPTHVLEFGLARILDGVQHLIDRAERARDEPTVAP